MYEPRGIRNCNPLNIRRTMIHWRGMRPRQMDPQFVEFCSMGYGYRAALINLRTYRNRYHWRTIRQIISHWAPKTENNVSVYIYHVCLWSGICNPDHILTDEEIPLVVAAMSRQENGIIANMEEIYEGMNLM